MYTDPSGFCGPFCLLGVIVLISIIVIVAIQYWPDNIENQNQINPDSQEQLLKQIDERAKIDARNIMMNDNYKQRIPLIKETLNLYDFNISEYAAEELASGIAGQDYYDALFDSFGNVSDLYPKIAQNNLRSELNLWQIYYGGTVDGYMSYYYRRLYVYLGVFEEDE
jgi:hypothetical protein